jgi:hypothetical protein
MLFQLGGGTLILCMRATLEAKFLQLGNFNHDIFPSSPINYPFIVAIL